MRSYNYYDRTEFTQKPLRSKLPNLNARFQDFTQIKNHKISLLKIL